MLSLLSKRSDQETCRKRKPVEYEIQLKDQDFAHEIKIEQEESLLSYDDVVPARTWRESMLKVQYFEHRFSILQVWDMIQVVLTIIDVLIFEIVQQYTVTSYDTGLNRFVPLVDSIQGNHCDMKCSLRSILAFYWYGH